MLFKKCPTLATKPKCLRISPICIRRLTRPTAMSAISSKTLFNSPDDVVYELLNALVETTPHLQRLDGYPDVGGLICMCNGCVITVMDACLNPVVGTCLFQK